MNKISSACGVDCIECRFINNECAGCLKVSGRPFWSAEYFADEPCPIYKCAVVEKKFENCGPCSELPCKLFFDLKDPDMSEEEHLKGITKRVDNLKRK